MRVSRYHEDNAIAAFRVMGLLVLAAAVLAWFELYARSSVTP